MESLAAQVPMLVMPFFGDQPFAATRIAAMGLGAAVPFTEDESVAPVAGVRLHLSASVLQEGFEQLFTARVRQNVAAMAKEIAELDPRDFASAVLQHCGVDS
jgi:UDP:flavonoid glycosyltransferase YjiC (YdhE family)